MSKGKFTIIVLVIFMVLAASIGGIYAYYSINQKEKTDLASIIASMEKEINKNVETITHLEQTLELNGLELEDLIKKEVEYKTIIDDRTKIQKEYIERKEFITRTLTDKQTIYRTKIETKTKQATKGRNLIPPFCFLICLATNFNRLKSLVGIFLS